MITVTVTVAISSLTSSHQTQLSALTSSPLLSTSPLSHYSSNVSLFGLLLIILVSLYGGWFTLMIFGVF
ncbi:hypothetical protein Patl1_11254 [Pistacia atlantica]|uniref:Uncharacterized protein n=1 Tax=Pistacia atlantica TaxID=434234 RepID=A0ACC1A5B9_9ROSI|nr:hypothetical protein Patl1_11254 [Pistacia atlantica]